MKERNDIWISGFADEISPDFDEQLRTVAELGMKYICLRTADGKSINDYSLQEAEKKLLPRLQATGIGVSSLGSAIGKIGVEDEEGFARQMTQLDTLCRICQLLDCRYIRVFSFYLPEGSCPENYRDTVLKKLRAFLCVAERHSVTLLNENEKDVYAETGRRCLELMECLNHPLYRSAFDFANFVQCGEDTESCWELLRSYVEYIHIKDAVATERENVLCGTGDGKIPLILERAIRRDGYKGFLTLEPHLVLFDALSSLERTPTEQIIKSDKAESGAAGFALQYRALCDIIKRI